jgi:LuxR family maltose regulon positive regulatory protein
MALARLRTPGVPASVAVDELVNGIASYGEPLAIVLDDLHAIGNDECLASLEHAVERLPAHARIVATTRSDPALPLGRLRARGALGEVRAAELAFRIDEARELLVDREGIALDDDDVTLLLERTEGWPAGLYLAALWLREVDDPHAGVRAFQGNHRHVADYLSGEVLETLDADTRHFLLETSALGRFSASLCDAVLGRTDSAARLRELERTNRFLIALDAQGEWFRYHHLFGELLQLELTAADPAAATPIHERAAVWCHEHGLIEDALDHAAEAGEGVSLAELLSSEHLRLLRSGRVATLLRWGAALPDEALVERPELPAAMALGAGLRDGLTPERRRYVALAERSRAEFPERWHGYQEALFALARLNWVERDLGESIALARATVELGRNGVDEATVPALTGLAYLLLMNGDVAESRAHADEALGRPEIGQRPHGHVMALSVLAIADADEGRLDAGEAHARAALATARDLGVGEVASGGLARVAHAIALAAHDKLRDAEREAVHGEKLRRSEQPELGHLYALVVLAGIRARRGMLAQAAADLAGVRYGLGAFTDAGRVPALADAVAARIEAGRVTVDTAGEAPSAAELSVLRLLATELSQREIGAHLFLSLNTVKTHTRSLYRKLGVASREDAVARANALGLLGGDSPG